jgi:uncharacterized membrane protein
MKRGYLTALITVILSGGLALFLGHLAYLRHTSTEGIWVGLLSFIYVSLIIGVLVSVALDHKDSLSKEAKK